MEGLRHLRWIVIAVACICIALLAVVVIVRESSPAAPPGPALAGTGPQQPQQEPDTVAAAASNPADKLAPKEPGASQSTPSPSAPRSEPEPQQAVLYQAPDPMGLAWDLSPAALEAISRDEMADEHLRGEARRRLRLRIDEIPGRHVHKLGGFSFDVEDYSMLAGFEVNRDKSSVTVQPSGGADTSPIFRMERELSLFTRPAVPGGHWSLVELTLGVWPSREWALREVGGPRPPAEGRPAVGDVWRYDSVSEGGQEDEADLSFARHNVTVRLHFRQGGGNRPPSIHNQLAWELDRKIQANAVRADTWADLSEHLPKVEQFELDPPALVAGSIRERAAIKLTVTGPNDEPVQTLARVESPPLFGGGERLLPVGVRPEDAPDSEQRYRVWVVAYLPNPLFTVAETTILVKPPADSDE